MSRFNRLYVYGDSYATPDFCVSVENSFWGLLAKDLEVDRVYNSASPGTSLDSISHRIVSTVDVIPEGSLLLVGIPILERFSTWQNHVDGIEYNNTTSFAVGNIVFGKDLKPVASTSTGSSHDIISMSLYDNPSEAIILHTDRVWLEISAMRTVLLLDQYIKSKGLECMFICLEQEFEISEYECTKNLIEAVLKMPNQILFENTLHSINRGVYKPVDYDKYGWQGHHGPAGNKNFYYNSLRPHMVKAGFFE